MSFLSSINFEPKIGKNYLQNIFNSVILKNIVKRNNIRDVDLLERIIAYALAKCRQELFCHPHLQVFQGREPHRST